MARPVDPSPTVEQAINGGYPFLELECSRCNAKRDVDLAVLPHVSTTFVHDLASRLVCQKCKKVGKRPGGHAAPAYAAFAQPLGGCRPNAMSSAGKPKRPDWKRRFDDPIILPDGRKLLTLRDEWQKRR